MMGAYVFRTWRVTARSQITRFLQSVSKVKKTPLRGVSRAKPLINGHVYTCAWKICFRTMGRKFTAFKPVEFVFMGPC